MSLVLLICLVGFGFAFMLNNSLRSVERFGVELDPATRPAAPEDESLNILLMGTDAGTARNGEGSSIIEDAAKPNWPTGKYRSDTMMIVHIPPDRESVYVISVPRDSYLTLHDGVGESRGKAKINAALSLYGPSGATATVENFSDLRMNHIAMLDWDGFAGITEALGGVQVHVSEPTRDWTAGDHVVEGDRALEYVRLRYGLADGDFDRIKRQQNFMRAVMLKTVSRGTLTNPLKLQSTTSAVAANMAVDSEFDAGAMRSLAWSLREVRPADVKFVTLPTNGTDSDPVAGSIVVVDQEKSAELFDSLQDDSIDDYLESNPDLLLPGSQQIQ